MLLVLDTNILVSAVKSTKGKAYRLLTRNNRDYPVDELITVLDEIDV